MDLYSGLKSMTENVRRSAANEPDSVDGPMFPLIFSRYLSFAPTSPDKKRREIWGTPYCFARKDVGDPTGYLTLLVADYTSSSNRVVLRMCFLEPLWWSVWRYPDLDNNSKHGYSWLLTPVTAQLRRASA